MSQGWSELQVALFFDAPRQSSLPESGLHQKECAEAELSPGERPSPEGSKYLHSELGGGDGPNGDKER
jgi:hypothetical protein